MKEQNIEEVLKQAKESLNRLKTQSGDALSGRPGWDSNDLLSAQRELLKSFEQIQSALEKANGARAKNERIREISEQAADEIADMFVTGFFDDRMFNEVAEINKKYIELIVQECCDVVRDEVQYISDFDKADAVVNEIKKHFGVE